MAQLLAHLLLIYCSSFKFIALAQNNFRYSITVESRNIVHNQSFNVSINHRHSLWLFLNLGLGFHNFPRTIIFNPPQTNLFRFSLLSQTNW